MEHKLNNIFAEKSVCYDIQTLKDYAENKLSDTENRKLELHIADCPICSDALEGLLLMPDTSKLPIIISELNSNIENRVKRGNSAVDNRIKPSIISINSRVKRVLSIAASLMIFAGLAFMVKFYMNDIGGQVADNISFTEKSEIHKENKVEEKSKTVITKETDKVEDKQVSEINKNKEVEDKENTKNVNSEINLEEGSIAKDEVKDEPIIVSDFTKESDDIASTNSNISANEKSESDDYVADAVVPESEEDVKPVMTTISNPVAKKEKRTFGAIKRSAVKLDKSKDTKNQAIDNFKKRKYDIAIEGFEKILAKNKSDADALYYSGASLYEMKKFAKSLSRMEQVIESGNDKYAEDALYYSGASLYEMKKFAQSLSRMEKVIKSGNNKYAEDALFYSGASLYEMKKFAKSLSRMEQVVKKGNKRAEEAEWYIALIYEGQNNTTDAIKTLNRIKARNGKFTRQAEMKLQELQN